jgi:regulator of RNase E activity RraA
MWEIQEGPVLNTEENNTTDMTLFDAIRRDLFSAVIGDVMDEMGLVNQFLPPNIRPLDNNMVCVGRAMPVLEADCSGHWVASTGRSEPFGKMFDALDDLKPGEIYICTGSSPRYALWGELMTIRARTLCAGGAVLNGFTRDTRGVLNLEFPVFSAGSYAQDQKARGRVIDYRCKISFPHGVTVSPGDLVFGDRDGVVIIPREREKEVLEAAYEKVRGENKVKKALLEGMSACDAYNTFGLM